MKKVCILFVSCILWICSFGQGTAYIKKCNIQGYSQMIRQWKTCPWPWGTGVHVVYYTDPVLNVKGFIGVTDIYNNFKYTEITDNLTIKDMEVLDNRAYFCGQTSANHAFIGWIDLLTVGYSVTNYDIDSMSFVSYPMSSLDNIVAYYDSLGRKCVAGYGVASSGYFGFEYNLSTVQYVTGSLPFVPHDVTVTDNYVVYTGTSTGQDIIIHPVPKTGTFTNPYLPFYSYQVGTATVSEPFARLHITSTGGDGIATISYRLEGSKYGMILREFDASGAFTIYNVPMLSSTLVKFNYPATAIFDFEYDAISRTYAVLHNYAISPSVYHDVVTKMDFSSGIPPSVPSHYLTISNHTMTSMSLSDSSMYVTYGYSVTDLENVFWKDYLPTSVTGPCLYSDILNKISILPTITGIRNSLYYSSSYSPNTIKHILNCRGSGEATAPICH